MPLEDAQSQIVRLQLKIDKMTHKAAEEEKEAKYLRKQYV